MDIEEREAAVEGRGLWTGRKCRPLLIITISAAVKAVIVCPGGCAGYLQRIGALNICILMGV